MIRPRRAFAPGLAPILFSCIVGAWTLLAFLPSLEGGFLNWDDPQTVVGNARIQGLDAENVRWAFSTFFMGHYQPLTWLSYAVDWSIWELDPLGFRLTNLLLHAATAILLLFVGRQLIAASGSRIDRFASWLAPLVGAVFFAVHPLRTESVAWVTERRDVLCGFFLVAATWAYLRASKNVRSTTSQAEQSPRWLTISSVFYALSLLSKASAVAFPAALVLLDLALVRRVRWLSKIPFAVLAAPYLVVAPMAQESTRAAISWDLLTLADRLWIAAYGLGFYLSKTVWPSGLSALHELPFPLGTRDDRFVHAAVLLVLVVVVAAVLYRRWPEGVRGFALASLAALAFLLPVLGLFQSGPQLVAERYTYFAALPLSAWLAAVFGRLAQTRFRTLVFTTALFCLVALTVVAHDTARTWRSDDDLWTRAVQVDPDCALCNAKLGHVRMAQGRTAQAEALFKAGLEKLPTMIDSTWALVKIYRSGGRWDEALPLLSGLLRRQPDVEANWQEMARALWYSRRFDALADLLNRLPPALMDRSWSQAHRRALAAVGGPFATPPTSAEDFDPVVALLADTGRCLPSDRVTNAPDWIRSAHAMCREMSPAGP